MKYVCSCEVSIESNRTVRRCNSEDNIVILTLSFKCHFLSSFSLDSSNLTVRAGAIQRGMLGAISNASFYVTYPDYDDESMDYDIALVKVNSAKLKTSFCFRSINILHSSATLECTGLRQHNQGCFNTYSQVTWSFPHSSPCKQTRMCGVVSPTCWQANCHVHVSFLGLSLRWTWVSLGWYTLPLLHSTVGLRYYFALICRENLRFS
jgi:hypothetical protein